MNTGVEFDQNVAEANLVNTLNLEVDLGAIQPDQAVDEIVPEISQEASTSRRQWLSKLKRPIAKLAVGLALVPGASALEAVNYVRPAEAQTPAHFEHYDYNMNSPEYSVPTYNNCGMVASADAVSFVLQRMVGPHEIHRHSYAEFSRSNQIVYDRGPYMTPAAKHLSKVYNFREYKTSLRGGYEAVKKLGAAMVMLSTQEPITADSHYIEADQVDANGRIIIHDPNQQPTRHVDKSHYAFSWVKDHVLNEAWVFVPKNEVGVAPAHSKEPVNAGHDKSGQHHHKQPVNTEHHHKPTEHHSKVNNHHKKPVNHKAAKKHHHKSKKVGSI